MARPRALSACLLALALATAGSAAAAPSASDKDIARKLMDDGKARMKEGDTAHAIEAFAKAHDIMHVPTTGLALAKAQVAAGRLVEAREVLAETIKLPRERGEPAVFDAARKQARELDRELKARVPRLRAKLRGAQAVRLSLDDAELELAQANDPIPVNPGKHALSARSVEGGEVTADFEIAERETKDIELVVPAQGSAKASPTAGAATPAKAPPPPETVRPPDAEREPERTSLAMGLIYGGFSVGAVGLVVGMITGGLTVGKASDITPLCERDICAPEVRGDLESARTLAAVATVSVIVGLAGAAVGIVGLTLPRKATATGSTGLRLGLQSGGIGGTF